jgi:hypothetical protein
MQCDVHMHWLFAAMLPSSKAVLIVSIMPSICGDNAQGGCVCAQDAVKRMHWLTAAMLPSSERSPGAQ